MALPTQGLGIVGTTIRQNGIAVASHLQFINWTNQHELEIDNDVLPLKWDLRIDAVDPATFNRPASDYAHTGAIDLGGRVADNVWQLAIQATNSIDAAGLTYELTTQNSNSYINSLMLSLGINLNAYLGQVTPQNDGLGFVGVSTDVRDKVAFSISGTAGDDWFFAGARNDILFGGAGNDHYVAAGGNDWMRLGTGNDYAEGGAGADSLYGDEGTDTLSYNSSAAGVTVYLSYGIGSGGDAQGDYFNGFENVTGSASRDILHGSSIANVMNGNGGNDWISGGAGNDVLHGGSGVDTLIGGQGFDQIYGGADSADYFYLMATDIVNGDRDIAMDFSAAGGDYFMLPAAFTASTYFSQSGNNAFVYIALATGNYAFFAINTSVADLQSHTYFF